MCFINSICYIIIFHPSNDGKDDFEIKVKDWGPNIYNLTLILTIMTFMVLIFIGALKIDTYSALT
jgi:hypothetical protein